MCLGGSKSRWYFLTVVFFNLADSVIGGVVGNTTNKTFGCENINEFLLSDISWGIWGDGVGEISDICG